MALSSSFQAISLWKNSVRVGVKLVNGLGSAWKKTFLLVSKKNVPTLLLLLLKNLKSLSAEPRGGATGEFENVLKGYYDCIGGKNRLIGRNRRAGTRVDSKKGGAFLAVCRGKVCDDLVMGIYSFYLSHVDFESTLVTGF